MHKILIIDSDLLHCILLSKTLLKENIESHYYLTASEGMEALKKEFYHLIILNTNISDFSIINIIKLIRKDYNLPLIIISNHKDSELGIQCLKNGADDFIHQPFIYRELLARVHSQIRRYIHLNYAHYKDEIIHLDQLTINTTQSTITNQQGTYKLLPKELAVLLFFVHHPGVIITRKDLYEGVWKETYVKDDNNVMVIMSRLRKKIEINPKSPQYIETIKGIGYRLKNCD